MEITAKFYSPDDIMEFVKYFGGTEPRTPEKPVKAQPAKKQAVDEGVPAATTTEESRETPAANPAPAEPAAEGPAYTLEEVRKKLATLSKEGKKDQVQQLLAAFSVNKLTELNPEDYPAVMEKAGKL